jgi:propanol-preferring alcohol dehydrogenase
VLATGVCHTELQLLAGTLNLGVVPITLGHEVVGEVVARGEGADAVRSGDRVLVYYNAPCDECAWCTSGREHLCPNTGPQVGFNADGGFAEFLRVPARNLFPLPDSLDSFDAAPLGCSAAAALHAVRAVADVQAGETVLVYGVGAVGLALVQLARLAGATVFAVGRSPDKLALARELGAQVVLHAREQDVVAETMRATRSEGVDVVFEVVGSAETMSNSVAMLRRRGRLVFVGYGQDRLQVNPLHLVLRELQVRGSLGNTRAELRETIQLAAEGKLRAIVARRLPLEEIDEALAALRRGEVVGRILLDPTASFDGDRKPSPGPARDTTPSPDSVQADHGPVDPQRLAHAGERAVDREAAHRPLEAELLGFVERGIDGPRSDDEFNALAMRLFAYQFEQNAPYRAFCSRRGRTPETVAHWREVPAVPISAFKEALLACEPVNGAQEFNSSGTTRPERKSRHFHPSLAVYDLNARLSYQAHMVPDGARLPTFVLFPPPTQMPNSSLAYWLAMMARDFSDGGGRWFVGAEGLDGPALVRALREAELAGQAVCILAASFGLVHFLDHCEREGVRFDLPPGSRLMDTGGYKGQSRELTQEALYGLARTTLGIEDDFVVNMYGLTEHSTQFLDAVLRNRVRGIRGPRYKTVPPWARTLVLDPDTLRPVPPGQLGLLFHFDLANRASVMAVLSEDVGYECEDGFVLLGRAQGTEARGCSIAVDELINAMRGAR